MSLCDERIAAELAVFQQDEAKNSGAAEKKVTFKDQVAADLDTFINSDEFADEHDLNGDTVKAIVESPTSQERWITGKEYGVYNGLRGIFILCTAARPTYRPCRCMISVLTWTALSVSSTVSLMTWES